MPEWNVEINEHEQIIMKQIIEILEKRCPKDKERPRKPHLSQETLQYVKDKNKVKRKVFEEVKNIMDKEWVNEDDLMIADLYKEQERMKNRRRELMKIVEHAPILEMLEKECKERLNDDKQRYVNETILKAEMAAAFNDSRMLFKCVKALKP